MTARTRLRSERGRSTAFTLIELLVVVAIILIVAAIIFPVYGNAKHSSGRAVTTSNLAQSHRATVIYLDGADWRFLPETSVMNDVLGREITCDPRDFWRNSCTDEPIDPLLGSFAYSGMRTTHFSSSNPDARFLNLLLDVTRGNSSQLPLYASVFEATNVPWAVSNDAEKRCHQETGRCPMPNRALVVFADGHVSTVQRFRESSLLWGAFFMRIATNFEVEVPLSS